MERQKAVGGVMFLLSILTVTKMPNSRLKSSNLQTDGDIGDYICLLYAVCERE